MPDFLILRLDAPMMSFGAPLVDNYGRTEHFMSLSALTGLLGNALGYSHGDADRLDALQDRLCFAQRCDRRGQELRDFQTVALGQDFLLSERAWTTWGSLDSRAGGTEAKTGTHIRYRDYIADAIYTLAVGIRGEEGADLDAIKVALDEPARPLFIGRKSCIPSGPLLLDIVNAATPLAALEQVQRVPSTRTDIPDTEELSAWWAENETGEHSDPSVEIVVTDERDWRNQIHSGQRRLRHGLIDPPQIQPQEKPND